MYLFPYETNMALNEQLLQGSLSHKSQSIPTPTLHWGDFHKFYRNLNQGLPTSKAINLGQILMLSFPEAKQTCQDQMPVTISHLQPLVFKGKELSLIAKITKSVTFSMSKQQILCRDTTQIQIIAQKNNPIYTNGNNLGVPKCSFRSNHALALY